MSPRTADGIPATYRERNRHAWELLGDQAEIYLETHVAALHAAAIQAESDVRIGVPHQSIAECADAVPESLIALATHGYGGLRRWAIGSVADKVLQAAPAPLLLVRPPTDAIAGVPDAHCAASTSFFRAVHIGTECANDDQEERTMVTNYTIPSTRGDDDDV